MFKPSARSRNIKSFLVMDVMAEAQTLEQQGHHIVHMEVGQPDQPTPPHIVQAANQALNGGHTGYTLTEGIVGLRKAIAGRYRTRYGVDLDPERVVVTMGSSPALFLTWGALLEPGDEVIVTDPHYACYPGTVEFLGGRAVRLASDPSDGFALHPGQIKTVRTRRTRAVLINSPSNPTGMIIEDRVLQTLSEMDDLLVVSDEIYHELEYGKQRTRSILEFTQNAFVLDGFSKRYCMTGWRLGWMVVPEAFVRPVRKMHQNYFISAAEFVQHAGIAAITGPQQPLAEMVNTYDRRRRFLIERLKALCFDLPAEPEGAFYVLADARKFGLDSVTLARKILNEAHVAVTPGVDFGQRAEGFLRFSYATSLDDIKLATERLETFCSRNI